MLFSSVLDNRIQYLHHGDGRHAYPSLPGHHEEFDAWASLAPQSSSPRATHMLKKWVVNCRGMMLLRQRLVKPPSRRRQQNLINRSTFPLTVSQSFEHSTPRIVFISHLPLVAPRLHLYSKSPSSALVLLHSTTA